MSSLNLIGKRSLIAAMNSLGAVSSLFRSVASFSITYPVKFHFLSNRIAAERFAFRLLSKFFEVRKTDG